MQAGVQHNNYPTDRQSYNRAQTRTEGSELSLNGSPGQGVGEDPGEAGQGYYSLLVHSAYKLLQLLEEFGYTEDLLV